MQIETARPVLKKNYQDFQDGDKGPKRRALLSIGPCVTAQVAMNLALMTLEENFKCSHLFFVTDKNTGT